MTRVLAELLGAEQPQFGMTLQQLEAAAGRPSTDIKLTTEILHRMHDKLRELNLDPHDTTPLELYRALTEKFKADEAAVRQAIGVTAEMDVIKVLAALQRFALKQITEEHAFAIKASVAKRLLKKNPPKKAMKQLNYRSVDSMLKHERVAFIYTAAFLCEAPSWRKKYLDQYAGLGPSDFEARPIDVAVASADRWLKLSRLSTGQHRQNVFTFKELGVVVVLPMEQDLDGLVIADLVMILNGCNEIICTASYLKLQQVRPDFGQAVRKVAEGDPQTNVTLINRQVPWRVIHQYYARFSEAYNPVIFEPHIHASDLRWRTPESVLADLHPRLSFWEDTNYTAQLKDRSHISLNLLDVAVNYCNKLPFAQAVVEFGRQHLWQELMVRYLNHDNVELALGQELQPELVGIDG